MTIWQRVRAFGSWLWSFLGDPKTKNALLVLLIGMTAFGMVAPESATQIRDIVLSLAF